MSAQVEAHDRPDSDDPEPDSTRLPDLASRLLDGGVVWATTSCSPSART